MQAKKSYHDYVIKDGKFIGEFEAMYKEVLDPWMQSQQPNKIARFATVNFLKTFKIESVLECGSGLGYFSNWIYEETGIVPISIDFSETAVARAKQLFPNLNFQVANVATDLAHYSSAGAVLLSEILWYILPDFNSILQELRLRFKNKYLLINQVFYKGTQQYGTEYFTSMDELIKYVPFPHVGHCESTNATEGTVETSTIFHIV